MFNVGVSGEGWSEKFECEFYGHEAGYMTFYNVTDRNGYKQQLILSANHFQVIEIEDQEEC